ncbi:site-specific DNA-methyltransferase [Salmonella enterica subsp. enterica]|nr:site-specific DNA-methyltransferase [Salmonella enterica subsp. enterica]EBS2048583.1 site-specific DNA-methyltransferase [Salmonella enterica subsp. enterica serovar Poona]ECC2068490.1 site-specific DNA-methyltransferase [Salmonella enterica]EBY5010611.1 site-specific DNA-methyltransferase [Salmonella enterica subsp. enterica serovar Poona]EBY9578230.1 site-specific DNA-methyltransferase [Salmonella enterica subsp. enterica serovar Poona]
MADNSNPTINKIIPGSTVGRGRSIKIETSPSVHEWCNNGAKIQLGNSLDLYSSWDEPTVIISDGAYGILGFEGDTADHTSIAEWYEPHIIEWSKKATAQTTLWFWNSEIGWASVHPILEKHGWRYINANIWNKGKGHIAGNVNTAKIRRFPVVTEMCVQYVFEPKINDLSLQHWLYREWKRTKLALKKANEACGVKNVATRKYLDQGHLWYIPPPEMFVKLVEYANEHGDVSGKPYFSADGVTPMSFQDWEKMRAKFYCPMGFTNVWERNTLKGGERISVPGKLAKAAHLNQKPLDLMSLIIQASSDVGDVIWEPFGGLFSASIAAHRLGRKSFAGEIDPTYFQIGMERFLSL